MPREREPEREASTASMASVASSVGSASSTSSSANRGVLGYGNSNSRYGRHRARSQLGQPPDLTPSSSVSSASSSMLVGSYTHSSSSPPPPPPPPQYSSSYEPVGYSTKPTFLRSTSNGSSMPTRTHRSPSATASKVYASSSHRRQASASSGNGASNRREANGSVLSDGDRREGDGIGVIESPPTSSSSSSMPTSAYPSTSSSSASSSAYRADYSQPPLMERTRSGSNASRSRYEISTSSAVAASSAALTGEDTPRRRARKVLESDDEGTGKGRETKPSSSANSPVDDSGGTARSRPVRIKYESATRGIGGGKREISHASLGKLIARLTDAHQYDVEFRDVFLLTFRCFCSPYDFIKKLMKRYTAVLTLCGGLDPDTLKETQQLLEQITKDEENDRSSTSTSISTAKSDINTGMEANVSIMRLLSVIKFWIKESGFIDMDLHNDRRAQKKLLTLLQEIQNTTPISSIRQHAESLLLSVAQLIRQQNAPASSPVHDMGASSSNFFIPPPPALTPSTSLSSVSSDHSNDANQSRGQFQPERSPDFTQSKLSSAMSKLKLTRSSSDSKKDRSMIKLKGKPQSSTDILQNGSYNDDPSMTFRRGSPMVTAPKMLRGVTTGSSEAFNSSSTHPLEDVIQDTIQRARLTASRSSSRTSYDNVQPLSGIQAQELADQLTLIEAEGYFSRINRRELTNKAWTRETKYKEAPHVMAIIELFDATAEWVSSEILHPQLQAAERARLIMLFIDAADNCHQMNNFNSLFEITTGLSAPCIRQLNTTWGLVSATSQEKYQVLMQVCSPEDNYRNYRQAFGLAEGQPRLPCSFILVKDLFTLEEAMKSTEEGLVNWQKFRKVYKVINEALERQNMNYLPPDGSNAAGISRKGKGALRHDRKVQVHIRHRLDTIRKDSTVLYQLARNANTQESILFVNSLSEAGFL